MSRERNPLMVQYEEKFPLGGLSLTNEDGTRWMHRMAASEKYYDDYSWDWQENQELLVDVKKMQAEYGGEKGGSYVMLARSIQQNFIASTYFRNPDPIIQDKNGDRDLSTTLSHVCKSVLADIGSERKMKEGLEDRWWAGFGLVWVSFRQEADELADGTLVPRKQRVLLKRMSPYRVRFDPEGREWDMSDHAYAAVLYYPTLHQLMTDRRLSDEDRRRTMASYKRGVEGDANFDWRSVRSTTVTDLVEDDPRYIRVPTWQIWARPEKKIYNQIAMSQFTMTPLDWPEEFAEEDAYPFVYMPAGREPEDKEATRGFVGIPYLREIKTLLYDINRLHSQFVAANQNAIFKYSMRKGVLDQPNQAVLQSDKQKAVVEWDPQSLSGFPAETPDKLVKFSDVFELIKQPELDELRHLAGIKHAMDMIAQIIGQAPGDRGGMPDSDTATDSIIVDKRLRVRENTHKHEGGGFFKQLVKLIWLVLKHRQELPIPYQMIIPGKEPQWAKFSADKLRDLDLHYDYAVGSNEDRTREEVFGLLERLAQAVMPTMQASGNLKDQTAIARLLLEALDVNGTDQLMQSDVQDLIAQLTAISYGIQRGEINPADPAIAQKQVELIAMLGDRLLTPDKMKQIVTESAGMANQGPAQETGSIAKAPTPGQADFAAGARGAAAAGAGGGMG